MPTAPQQVIQPYPLISLPNYLTDANGNPITSTNPVPVVQQSTASVNGTLQNAQASSANGTALALLGSASIIFTVNMAGFTGTVNFECTEDNTNWDPLQVQQEGTNSIVTSVTGSTTTAVHLYEASVAGLQSVRARTSGAAAGTVTVTAHAIPTTDASRVVNAVAVGGVKPTYVYAVSATAPYATPTDWIVIRGSATKTIKVARIEISGAATAATNVVFTIKKHTIANTGGTSTTPTPMQQDSNDAAASATVLLYSAAPTIDASATIWKTVRLNLALAPAAASGATDRYVYNYGSDPYEPLTLRGVAQEMAINFGGAAVPSGGVYDVAIVFTEE